MKLEREEMTNEEYYDLQKEQQEKARELQKEYLASRFEVLQEEYSDLLELCYDYFTTEEEPFKEINRLRSLIAVDSLHEIGDSISGLEVALVYTDDKIREEMEEAGVTVNDMINSIMTKNITRVLGI